MKCSFCGSEMNSSFCPSCGRKNIIETNTPDVPVQNTQNITDSDMNTVVQNEGIFEQLYSGSAHMDFTASVQYLLRNYANFSGRSSVSQFWWGYLFVLIASIIPFAGLILLIPSLASCIRRLHDAGYSGSYYFLILIPFVGSVILLILYIKPSVPKNKWGYPPQ